MAQAIGSTLPLALGIALNPIAIIACIALLTSSPRRAHGVAFIIGWVAGLIALTGLGLLLTKGEGGSMDSKPSTTASYALIVAGAALISLAFRIWRTRPAEGTSPDPPRWLERVSRFGIGRSFAMGAILMIASAKDLALAPAAGNTLAEADLAIVSLSIAGVIFVALATLSLFCPVVVSVFGGERGAHRIEGWRSWLMFNNATITAILFLILGFSLLGDGLTGL